MEPFSIIKFFAGFNPFRGASLAKLLFTGIVAVFAVSLIAGIGYKLFYAKSTAVTVEEGANYIVNEEAKKPMMGIGCNLLRGFIKAGVK